MTSRCTRFPTSSAGWPARSAISIPRATTRRWPSRRWSALYLAAEPRHLPDDADQIIEQAVRYEFRGDVPDAVSDWLAGRTV
jgi:hypothetical protein